jgi:enamine deaminase RidA (YjgF/YER057c/UK114 family)
MNRILLILPAIFLLGCEITVDETPHVSYLQMPGMEGHDLPFSSAVRVDDTLYLSGNLGNIPGTLDLAEGGIQGETRLSRIHQPAVRLVPAASRWERVSRSSVLP